LKSERATFNFHKLARVQSLTKNPEILFSVSQSFVEKERTDDK
jgi:hypothetical protein